MKKYLHIVTMSCIQRQQNATTWCLEVMHAQRLEIVHVSGTANFATTVLALLPAQLLALVQAVLQATGPSFSASTFAGTWPGIGASDIAATWLRHWCRC